MQVRLLYEDIYKERGICVKKVKGPIIAAIVIILMVIVVMVVFSLRGRQVNITDDGIKLKEEHGIHFGGTFDEFQYFEEDETETVLNREEILSEVEKKREEFLENAPGDIIREEDEETNMNSIKKIQNTEEAPDVQITEDENGEFKLDSGLKLDGYSENEVLYETTSMEDAQTVAAQIGGTVISCEQGMALIQISEHVDVLLERLEKEGSELILYRKYKIAK